MMKKIKERMIKVLQEEIPKMEKIKKELESGKSFNRIAIWKKIGTIYPTKKGFIDDLARKKRRLLKLKEVV
jgi:inorganic pyrophosphatase